MARRHDHTARRGAFIHIIGIPSAFSFGPIHGGCPIGLNKHFA